MERICGCLFQINSRPNYLPLIDVAAHAKIDSLAYKNTLTQNFNNSESNDIQECQYIFPIYDGVSVIAFTCIVGSRTIKGIVKEKAQARKDYDEAVESGHTAGLLEQGRTSDVFAVNLGNIPAGAKVTVKIEYVGELKHDLGIGGIRFTLPTFISPRYGNEGRSGGVLLQEKADKVTILIDVNLPTEHSIENVRSPSHPIELKLGTTSSSTDTERSSSKASATLALGTSSLDKDFVLEILHKDNKKPKAILERHEENTKQRALMVTLVPESIPGKGPLPELIVVADQSGSMRGSRTQVLVSALRILLKSIPVETKFNICAFGSSHRLLWNTSQHYDQAKLDEATGFVNGFNADYGGTETLSAVQAAIESRDKERNLALILATDGDIWAQEQLFDYLNAQVADSKTFIRVLPLGIGNSVSSSLIEGVARAGNGFAQTVGEGEKQDAKVIRMLKGALTPDTGSWTMEVKFKAQDDGFELIERVTESLRVSILDDFVAVEDEERDEKDKKAAISPPKLLQAPQTAPPLYPQSRSTLYVLLSPDVVDKVLDSVIVRNNSDVNPFEMSIPVEELPVPGTTIHSLAAKRAILELEEGRGWLTHAIDPSAHGKLLKQSKAAQFDELVKAECVRLGEQYHIAGKFTSVVAIDPEKPEQKTIAPADPPSPPPVQTRGGANAVRMRCSGLSSVASFGGPPPPPGSLSRSRGASSHFASPSYRGPSAPGVASFASTRNSSQGFRELASVNSSPAPRKQLASMAVGSPSPRSKKMKAKSSTPVAQFDMAMDVDEDGNEKVSKGSTLDELIALQTFSGYWNLNDKLLRVMNVTPQAAKNVSGVEDELWATALAVLFLETKLGDEKDSWEMVVDKARGWLSTQGYGDEEGDGMIHAFWEKARVVVEQAKGN